MIAGESVAGIVDHSWKFEDVLRLRHCRCRKSAMQASSLSYPNESILMAWDYDAHEDLVMLRYRFKCTFPGHDMTSERMKIHFINGYIPLS